jgi:hypothetical protein
MCAQASASEYTCGKYAQLTSGLEGLHELHHLEVGHLDGVVLAGRQVGLGHQHALCVNMCDGDGGGDGGVNYDGGNDASGCEPSRICIFVGFR